MKNLKKTLITSLIVISFCFFQNNFALASNYIFEDDFSVNTFIDTGNTDAIWDEVNDKFSLEISSSAWTQMDGSTPGYENVSNSTGSSQFSSIIDSNNNPIVTWDDDTSGIDEIFISKWDGTAWTQMDGITPGYENVSNSAGSSFFSSIAIDSNDNIIVVWEDNTLGNNESFISKWNGTAWTQMDGITPGYENISNNAGSSRSPSIAIDSNDSIIVAWEDSTPENGEVMVSKWNGTTWTQVDGVTPGYENISNNAGSSRSPSIAIDSNDSIIVAWEDSTSENGEVMVSKWNETAWTQMDGSTPGYENISNNAGESWWPRMVLDSNNNPIITWEDNTLGNSESFISKWNGTAWTQMDGITPGYENVSNNVGSSIFANIAIGSNDDLFSTWTDDSFGNFEVVVSKWNGTAWTQMDGVTPGYENISNNAGDSGISSAVIDSSGNPIIIWEDYTSEPSDIFISKLTTTFTSPATVQSLKVNGAVTNISKATLTATDSMPGSSNIDYFLSNDAGATWNSVTNGVEYYFATPGDDLRWKAVLYEGSNPVLNSVSISYSAMLSSGTVTPIVTVEEDTINKNSKAYKCYKEYKQKYSNDSYKQDSEKVKYHKKHNYFSVYWPMKLNYLKYRKISNEEMKNLKINNPEEHQKYKEYYRYRKYKKYKECKRDVFGD